MPRPLVTISVRWAFVPTYAVHHGRCGGSEIEVAGLRIDRVGPQRRAIHAVTEQADVAEQRVNPLTVGGRRFRRVAVLAVTPAHGRSLVRFALPADLPGLH